MALEDRSHMIDRDSPVFLPVQVADDLRELIAARKVSGRMPSEIDLMEQYQVSRVTVRRAVAILRDESLVVVLPGRGAFVTRGGSAN